MTSEANNTQPHDPALFALEMLAMLRPKQHRVIVEHVTHPCLTQAQLAIVLGTTQRNVSTLLRRGLANLEELKRVAAIELDNS